MILDAIAVLLVLVLALIGFRRGGAIQILLLIALASALLLGPSVAPVFIPFAHWLLPDASARAQHLVTLLTAATALYFVLAMLISIGVGLIRSGSFLLRGLDGIIGLLIGIVKGVALALLFAWSMRLAVEAEMMPPMIVAWEAQSYSSELAHWLHHEIATRLAS